jgi:hypothetical protein
MEKAGQFAARRREHARFKELLQNEMADLNLSARACGGSSSKAGLNIFRPSLSLLVGLHRLLESGYDP